MFQVKNKLYSKVHFDNFLKENYYQFNYLNHYQKLLINETSNSDTENDSDIGWSCTIKSIQMLFASYFAKNHCADKIIPIIYKDSGFISVHSFIKMAYKLKYKETLGDYYGIHKSLCVFNNLIRKYDHNYKILNYEFHMTTDNIIDITQIHIYKPTILLFSTRLGANKLENYYKELILKAFTSCQFDGLLGGVGQSCYFFIAKHTCADNLIYLDPHFVTDYNENISLNDLKATNYLCTHIDTLDPSMTFCFSYRNYKEFLELKKFLEKNTIFDITNKEAYININSCETNNSKRSNKKLKENEDGDWALC